MIYCRY